MANQMSDAQLENMCLTGKALGFRLDRLYLLDQRLTEWSKNGKTPAIAARVLRHGQVAFEGAYGPLSPDSANDSLRVDSIFPICSMTKPVVATLACIMQEEGLLDLNAPLKDYIPEFTGDSDGLVRLWHLLCHSSGLIDHDLGQIFDAYVSNTLKLQKPSHQDSDETWNSFFKEARKIMGLSELEGSELRDHTYQAIVLAAKPTYPPQKIMRYSSMGYNLIMRIINQISCVPIDTYAKEKLFDPLQMKDSHFLFPSEKKARFVQRDKAFTGSEWLNGEVLQSTGGGGGLKSTAVDMTRFGQMYINGGALDGERVLSKASIRMITTSHNAGLPEAFHNGGIFDPAWGLGWNVGSKKDDAGMLRSSSSFEHGGFGCVKLLCDLEADIVAAFFSVSIEDNYLNVANFNNMVLGALVD